VASSTTDRWLSTLSADGQQSMLALHDAFWQRENCRILNRLCPHQPIVSARADSGKDGGGIREDSAGGQVRDHHEFEYG